MKKPNIIAHRGFWTKDDSKENSIKALKQAQELKIYGSEFDVQMTTDGVPVLNHDHFLEGFEIAKTEFQTLFSKKRAAGNGFLVTLENYLKKGLEAPWIKLIMEIKDNEDPGFEKQAVVSCVYLTEKYALQEQVEYISFSLNICKALKEVAPYANVKYLKGDLIPEAIKDLGLDGFNYEFPVYQKNPDWITAAKELDLSTGAWTVNEPEIFMDLKEKGIDFITTDWPDIFMNAI